MFVGFKGGDNAANHSHLDLGSFVLDAAGQRWALDLGGDDYNLPAYFGKNRWTYFRLRTESHNTLTIGGQNQATRARAPIVAYRSTPARSFAVADLTRAYDPEVASARRGIALLERRRVLVQDELTPAKTGDLQWRMVTRAKVALAADARVATLTQKGATLTARIVEPSAARFEVIPAAAPPPQRQQPDARILTVKLPLAGEPVRLAVVFEPDGQGAGNPLPTIEPLDRWVADGPLAARP
ncbi:MAG: heparinase II/III family protein [Isosphaeraceae bacterium]